MSNYRRISIQVDEGLYQRLSGCFEWGERNRVLTRMLEWLCEKVERHGKNALVVILREDDFGELVNMGVKKDGNDQ